MDAIQYGILSLGLFASAAWLLHEFWRGMPGASAPDRETPSTRDASIPTWLRAVPEPDPECAPPPRPDAPASTPRRHAYARRPVTPLAATRRAS